jgi:hypothetical protein
VCVVWVAPAGPILRTKTKPRQGGIIGELREPKLTGWFFHLRTEGNSHPPEPEPEPWLLGRPHVEPPSSFFCLKATAPAGTDDPSVHR